MSRQTDELLAAGWTRTPGERATCGMQRKGYAKGELCDRRAIWSKHNGEVRLCLTHAQWWTTNVEAAL